MIADLDRGLAVYEVAAKSRAGAEALLAAQLDLATSELAMEDSQTRMHQALGALEDAVQRPLPAWPDLEQGRAAQAKQEKP